MRDNVSVLEITSAIVLAVGGFASLFTPDGAGLGASIASFIGAALLVLDFFVRNESLFDAANRFRRFFLNGAGVARVLMLIVTVGGTLLVIDRAYEINAIVIEWLDPLFKRLAPALLVNTAVLYAASIVGTVMYRASEIGRDRQIRGYEFFFYVSATILVLSVTILAIGSPVEMWMYEIAKPHENSVDWRSFRWPAPLRENDPYEYYPGGPIYRGFIVAISISTLWAIGTYLCVVSRGSEWFFKEGGPLSMTPEATTTQGNASPSALHKGSTKGIGNAKPARRTAPKANDTTPPGL